MKGWDHEKPAAVQSVGIFLYWNAGSILLLSHIMYLFLSVSMSFLCVGSAGMQHLDLRNIMPSIAGSEGI